MTEQTAIKILTKRASWLAERVEAAKVQGLPYSFDAAERSAILTLIAIAKAQPMFDKELSEQ